MKIITRTTTRRGVRASQHRGLHPYCLGGVILHLSNGALVLGKHVTWTATASDPHPASVPSSPSAISICICRHACVSSIAYIGKSPPPSYNVGNDGGGDVGGGDFGKDLGQRRLAGLGSEHVVEYRPHQPNTFGSSPSHLHLRPQDLDVLLPARSRQCHMQCRTRATTTPLPSTRIYSVNLCIRRPPYNSRSHFFNSVFLRPFRWRERPWWKAPRRCQSR
jgi:hypothetical protein